MALRWVSYVVCAWLSLVTVSCCFAEVPPKSILFVGNSYSALNGGVDVALKSLAPTAKTTRITPNGYYLKTHWENGNTLAQIKGAAWDYVVMQEQSQLSVFNYEMFSEFAEKFDAEIKKTGAKTVLFMTWERPDSAAAGVTFENVANAYSGLAKKIGAKVAPVGVAFERARQERPDLKLFTNDGHPTAQGTYLAACVFFVTIYGGEALFEDNAQVVNSLEEREFLQRIAKIAS